jgi:hypothetical protein
VVVKTPAQPPLGGREVKLDLALAEDGTLSGDVLEIYSGFEAAQLAETLEGVSNERRDQALQQALSRYFAGAELSNLRLDVKRRWARRSRSGTASSPRGFARVDDNRMTLGPLTYPAQVGRRYVTVGTRRSPLFIDSTEQNISHVALRLPKGWRIDDPLKGGKLESPSGSSPATSRRARCSGSRSATAGHGAHPGGQYEAFAGFAGRWTCSDARPGRGEAGPLKNPAGRTER